MKSICYYFACVFSWTLIVLLFATFRTFLQSDGDFWYSLGGNVVNIPLWIVSLGIVLYSRPYLYLLAFEKKKAYNQTTSIIVFGLGLLLIILRGVVNLLA